MWISSFYFGSGGGISTTKIVSEINLLLDTEIQLILADEIAINIEEDISNISIDTDTGITLTTEPLNMVI